MELGCSPHLGDTVLSPSGCPKPCLLRWWWEQTASVGGSGPQTDHTGKGFQVLPGITMLVCSWDCRQGQLQGATGKKSVGSIYLLQGRGLYLLSSYSHRKSFVNLPTDGA